MKLGFASISALDRSLADAAAVAAGAGLDGLEVTQRSPHFTESDGPARAREALRAVREAGIEVIAYGSYLGMLGERTAARAAREVAVAAALETPRLRVWAEGIQDAPEGGFAPTVGLMQQVCDAAQAEGITVVAERHIGSFVDTPERIHRLFEAVGRENFALNYQVLDFLPADRVDAQAEDARELTPLARYFHLKNYRPNPEEGGPLAPGGSLEGGVLDYRAILFAALEAGYAGPLTIEFLSWEPKSVEQKLAADVAFVRALLAEKAEKKVR
jgi:sugar phosphate isomerase/epimerase